MEICLEEAVALAALYHCDQKDKVGEPYLLHLLRVMLKMRTPVERVAALLHDVLEDTGMTEEDLRAEGIPDEAIEAVVCLTRQREESYIDFIDRCLKNDLAKRVKIADIEDHLEQDDITKVLPFGQRSKYEHALVRLRSG